MTRSDGPDAGALFRPGADLTADSALVPAPRSGDDLPDERVDEPSRRGAPLGALLALVLGLLAVLRVAVAAGQLPATPGEARLVDGAFAALRLPGSDAGAAGPGEVLARLQLTAHAALTGAFDRYPDVLDGARELAVLAFVVLLVAVALVARSPARPGALAVLLALFVLCEPAVAAVATFGPGQLGAMWLAVGAALLLRRSALPRALGVVAVLVGVLTAPLLLVAVVLAVVAAAARTVPAAALGAAAALAVLGGVLLVLGPPPVGAAGAVDGGGRVVLVLVALAVAGAGALRRENRPVAVALAGAALLVAAVPGDTAHALLVAAVLVAGAAVVDVLPRPATALVAVAGAAWIGAAVVVATTAWSGPPAPSPHRDLAAWITATTDPATALAVPAGLRSDLLRDGVPVERFGPAPALAVVEGPGDRADRLAVFGTGPRRLTVVPTAPATDADPARSRAGAQLGRNPRLDAPDDVRAQLTSGAVDPRALAVLGGLAGRDDVTVTALPVVDGEDPAAARHRVVLAATEPDTLGWLRAQQPPYAPLIAAGADGAVTLTWPLPAPATVLAR